MIRAAAEAGSASFLDPHEGERDGRRETSGGTERVQAGAEILDGVGASEGTGAEDPGPRGSGAVFSLGVVTAVLEEGATGGGGGAVTVLEVVSTNDFGGSVERTVRGEVKGMPPAAITRMKRGGRSSTRSEQRCGNPVPEVLGPINNVSELDELGCPAGTSFCNCGERRSKRNAPLVQGFLWHNIRPKMTVRT